MNTTPEYDLNPTRPLSLDESVPPEAIGMMSADELKEWAEHNPPFNAVVDPVPFDNTREVGTAILDGISGQPPMELKPRRLRGEHSMLRPIEEALDLEGYRTRATIAARGTGETMPTPEQHDHQDGTCSACRREIIVLENGGLRIENLLNEKLDALEQRIKGQQSELRLLRERDQARVEQIERQMDLIRQIRKRLSVLASMAVTDHAVFRQIFQALEQREGYLGPYEPGERERIAEVLQRGYQEAVRAERRQVQPESVAPATPAHRPESQESDAAVSSERPHCTYEPGEAGELACPSCGDLVSRRQHHQQGVKQAAESGSIYDEGAVRLLAERDREITLLRQRLELSEALVAEDGKKLDQLQRQHVDLGLQADQLRQTVLAREDELRKLAAENLELRHEQAIQRELGQVTRQAIPRYALAFKAAMLAIEEAHDELAPLATIAANNTMVKRTFKILDDARQGLIRSDMVETEAAPSGPPAQAQTLERLKSAMQAIEAASASLEQSAPVLIDPVRGIGSATQEAYQILQDARDTLPTAAEIVVPQPQSLRDPMGQVGWDGSPREETYRELANAAVEGLEWSARYWCPIGGNTAADYRRRFTRLEGGRNTLAPNPAQNNS